ncbi:hypothetical protein [Rhodobacter sp. CZR27]|uniref:hypothetical protein n=1 Tax=Rhodobacter sp. CZR27 TaxID=2033869 RepID=UPI000BBF227F|nr:hypothetical protein [Rhodobacter sp. CZR27]
MVRALRLPFRSGAARVLLLTLLAALALLAFRPGALPLTQAELFASAVAGMEICHDGGSQPVAGDEGGCVLCHLIAGASPETAPAAHGFVAIRYTRLAPPLAATFADLRSLRPAQARGPPVSGFPSA